MPDPFAERAVFELPSMESVVVVKDLVSKTGRTLDVYRSPAFGDQALPGVVFVPGDAPDEIIANAKQWGQYVSWGQLVALSGLAAVTINHRSTNEFKDLEGAAQDVDAAVDHIRTNGSELRIDPERIAIWTCSAGAPFALRTALRDRPGYIRALVALYSIMDLRPGREVISADIPDQVLAAFSCSYHVETGGSFPPMLVARAGKDQEFINRSIEAFVRTAVAAGVEIEYVNHAEGQHAFDIRDSDARSRAIIKRTLDFLRAALLGERDPGCMGPPSHS
jgi:acetyl esterase/lipase